MDEKLLNYLRCPGCHSPFIFEGQNLVCSGCRQTYSFFKNIPQLLDQSALKDSWQRYFEAQIREKGDSVAANSYLNQGHFRRLQQTVLETIGKMSDKVIVDVGCGTGHFTSSLASQNILLGLDLSLEMLLAAEAKGFFPVQARATELPLADNAFDLVMANSVIQCLPDARKFLTELVRVSNEGGRIIISGFNSQNIFLRAWQHLEITRRPPLFFHPLNRIIEILADSGAQTLKVRLLFYPLRTRKDFFHPQRFRPACLYLASSFVLEARKTSP
jgi:ubiquinone/menaquinone biosynthesis C-methylase UbiE